MNVRLKSSLSLALLFGMIAVAQDAPRSVIIPIGESAFTVPARGAKQYKFVVPAGAIPASLEGHFTATGGPRSSIEVWVMNDDQFVNWANQHPLRVIYNSQRVTQGTIKLTLPADGGTYHVVFSNAFRCLLRRLWKAASHSSTHDDEHKTGNDPLIAKEGNCVPSPTGLTLRMYVTLGASSHGGSGSTICDHAYFCWFRRKYSSLARPRSVNR